MKEGLGLDYIREILKRGFVDTFTFFGWNKSTLIFVALSVVGIFVNVSMNGLDQAMDDFFSLIATVLIPVGGFAILLLVYNLMMAPFRIYADQKAQVNALTANFNPDIAKALRDAHHRGMLLKGKLHEDQNAWYRDTHCLIKKILPNSVYIFENADNNTATHGHDVWINFKLDALANIITEYQRRQVKG